MKIRRSPEAADDLQPVCDRIAIDNPDAATRSPLCRTRQVTGALTRSLVSLDDNGTEEARIMASLDWSECPAVESIPGKVSGAWVLRGTRMPVSAIFENIEAGASIDDIMEWFEGLDRGQVKAVIEFAARSLDRAPALTP